MRITAKIRALCRPLEPLPTSLEPRLEHIEGVRAALFDIYGTLLISGSGDVGSAITEENDSALEQALRAVGIRILKEDAPRKGAEMFIATIRDLHAKARQAGKASPEIDVREVWKKVLAELKECGKIEYSARRGLVEEVGLEYECRVNPVWPMPNTCACLRALKNSGRKLGIVSNAQFYTPLILQALLEGFPEGLGFDRRLTQWSYEILESKPSPGVFEKPLRNLKDLYGIAPGECVYVGNDTRNDIVTAKALGLRTILFAGDQRSLRLGENDEACRGIQPDAIATDLKQIAADIIV